jgi:transcriptional regulator of acetoin/glycerol metabolism
MSGNPKPKTANDEFILELSNASLYKAEATLIHQVLQETNWNIRRAAQELHIPRGTLYSKMKKHKIKRPPAPLNEIRTK